MPRKEARFLFNDRERSEIYTISLSVDLLISQMFRLRDLITALQACSSTLSEISDEASAIEQAGQPVKLVAGREDNIKVTVAEDLDLVSAILANGCS